MCVCVPFIYCVTVLFCRACGDDASNIIRGAVLIQSYTYIQHTVITVYDPLCVYRDISVCVRIACVQCML